MGGEDAGGTRGPHGGRDGDDEVATECRSVAAVVEEVAEGSRRGRGTVQCRPGVAVEPQDIADHPPVARASDRAGLGEPAADATRAELDPAGTAGGSKRHVARLGRDAELAEEPEEGRVRRLVVD